MINNIMTNKCHYLCQPPNPPGRNAKQEVVQCIRSSTIVSPINNKSSFSQPALSMLALTALSLPSLSQNDKTEPLQVSEMM